MNNLIVKLITVVFRVLITLPLTLIALVFVWLTYVTTFNTKYLTAGRKIMEAYRDEKFK